MFDLANYLSLNSLRDCLLGQGLKIASILLAGLIAQRILNLLVRSFVHRAQVLAGNKVETDEARIKTLRDIITSAGSIFIWLIVLLTVLSELGIDIGPLIASAGVVGFAIGFGSQQLVRDFISGFFILLENQFNRGDVIEVGGKKGRVVKINLRTTLLFDDGENKLHIIPNSQITAVTRLKKAK